MDSIHDLDGSLIFNLNDQASFEQIGSIDMASGFAEVSNMPDPENIRVGRIRKPAKATIILTHLLDESDQDAAYAPNHQYGPKASIREKTSININDVDYVVTKFIQLGALSVERTGDGRKSKTLFRLNKEMIRKLIEAGEIRGIDPVTLEPTSKLLSKIDKQKYVQLLPKAEEDHRPWDEDILGLHFDARKRLEPKDNLLLMYTTRTFNRDYDAYPLLTQAIRAYSGLVGEDLVDSNRDLLSAKYVFYDHDKETNKRHRMYVTREGHEKIREIAEKMGIKQG